VTAPEQVKRLPPVGCIFSDRPIILDMGYRIGEMQFISNFYPDFLLITNRNNY